MRFALMGQRLGHQVFVVLEQLAELETVLRVADEMGIYPTLGVRIKLATEGSGRWAKSGGERSKFGLSAVELIKLLDRLSETGRKDALKLVHFHLGSQITDIRYIKAGLEEIGRYYVEIREMGFDLTHVDVGGGLGVDYEGSRTTRSASMNYSIREYANDVVYNLGSICRQFEGVRCPTSSRNRAGLSPPTTPCCSQCDRGRGAHRAGGCRAPGPIPPRCWWSSRRTSRRSTLDRVEEVLPRRRLRQGAGPGAVRERGDHPAGPGRHRAVLPLHHERDGAALIGRATGELSRDLERTSKHPGRPVLLQLLGLPVAPRQLGHRPALPDHADPPAPGGADPARHAPGHHLRFRRRDRPLRRRPQGEALPGAAPLSPRTSPTSSASSSPAPIRRSWATCTTCSATPTRSTCRLTDVGLRDHRPGPRRHGDRGAQLRPVPRRRPASDLPAEGRRGHATCSRPEANSLHCRLRGGSGGVHLPRGGAAHRAGAGTNGAPAAGPPGSPRAGPRPRFDFADRDMMPASRHVWPRWPLWPL